MNEDSKEYTSSNEEEVFDSEAFGKALELLCEKKTIMRISEAAKRISGKEINLCVLKEKRQFEESPTLYFVVTSEEAMPLGGLILEIKKALHCSDISVVHKSWGSYREFTEVSAENIPAIESFLAKNYKDYQIKPKSPLTQSREQHGVFNKSPVLSSPRGTGKETKQPSPEATSPRVEETQTFPTKKLGSPGSIKK